MTVPIQRGSAMAVLQPPRSRFMITDILGGGGNVGHHHHQLHHHHMMSGHGSEDGHSPSPGPRDLSVGPTGSRNDDSDSDSSGQLDNHSICSNGMYIYIFIHICNLS